ncbi:hypothetical protein DL96DRAFT_1632146 [Flagelloscypha sp. PMI_526]|nr:hypothetical protein DL96DRAFT_1632146 [Flagelloscypha sp. PMI_526]
MHRALEIFEIRKLVVDFADPSTLLPLATTCKLFTDFALQSLYEETTIDPERLNRLLATTLSPNAESRVLSAMDCEAFLRVARHTLVICQFSEHEFANLPRIITRDSPILFPKLQHLTLDHQIEDVWYPAIQAYLPPTLRYLGLSNFRGNENPSDAHIALCRQQQREFFKFLAERPEKESFSLSELYFYRYDCALEEESSSHLTRFIRTQHKLAVLQVDYVPPDFWPFLASLRYLQKLLLNGYCIPFDLTTLVSLNNVSRLDIQLPQPWQKPRGVVTGVAFTSLQELSIDGPLEYLASLVKSVQGNKLKYVVIRVRDAYDLSLMNDLLCHLRSEVSTNSLECFRLQLLIWNIAQVSFEAFHSILCFTVITELTINTLSGTSLEDSDLALLTNSLPNLQEILITPPDSRPLATLHALGHFTKCPQMRCIEVGFLPILPSGTRIPSGSSSRVDTISYSGNTYLSEDELVVADVVAFLEAGFPNLQFLMCPFSDIICGAHPKLFGK